MSSCAVSCISHATKRPFFPAIRSSNTVYIISCDLLQTEKVHYLGKGEFPLSVIVNVSTAALKN